MCNTIGWILDLLNLSNRENKDVRKITTMVISHEGDIDDDDDDLFWSSKNYLASLKWLILWSLYRVAM